jgi:hypothetical protein
MSIGMWRVKAVLISFQIDMRTVLEIGLEFICVIFWQRAYPHFIHALRLHRGLN